MSNRIDPTKCLIEQFLEKYPHYTRELPPDIVAAVNSHCLGRPVYLARPPCIHPILKEPIAEFMHASLDYPTCLNLLAGTLIHNHTSGGLAGWKKKEREISRSGQADPPTADTPITVLTEEWESWGHTTLYAWEIILGSAAPLAQAIHKAQFAREDSEKRQLRKARITALGERMFT